MVSIADVKQRITEALRADGDLASLLGRDASGQTPIYQDWIMGRMLWLPSITISDVYVRCESGGLNDAYDGLKRYMWSHALIQIDVWAKSPGQRDKLSARVQQALLVADFGDLGLDLSPPLVIALAEPERSVYRHSIRYSVLYIVEVSV
ncbi:MAG: hypothetical protein QXT26_04520 [Thermoproteota archaeon]